MNTPRLLLFGLFLPPHTYLPSREQNVHPEVFFLSVGLHLAIMATFLSRSRDLFSLLLTDVVIGLLLNVTHYMPFILPDLPHRTDYSLSEGDLKKIHFTIKNYFPKKVIKKSRNQSTNLFLSIRGMGLRRSSEPKVHV